MARELVRVGCCGFGVSRQRYFENLSVVEIQQTFYQPPRPSTAERWRAEAPDRFEFTLKAWQLITHTSKSPTYRRLRTDLSERERLEAGAFRTNKVVLTAWERTAEIARALKAEKIIFQCPASFKPTEENKGAMARFFEAIDREGFTLVWEPRGAWQPGEIRELCRQLKLVHCVDPFSNKPVTLSLRYFRLHGKGGYRYQYTEQDLTELAALVKGSSPAYVLFNNASMYEDALRFRSALR